MINYSDKVGCVCIIDSSGEFLNDYSHWSYSIFKQNFLQEKFDVYVATIDESAFNRSSLKRFLDGLQQGGIIDRIFPIRFHLHSNDPLERYFQQSSFCENFREVNQFLNDRQCYSFYQQVCANQFFGYDKVEQINKLYDGLIDPSTINLFMYLNPNVNFLLNYFSSVDRHKFSCMQNIWMYVKSSGQTTLDENERSLVFFIKKFANRQNSDLVFLDDL